MLKKRYTFWVGLCFALIVGFAPFAEAEEGPDRERMESPDEDFLRKVKTLKAKKLSDLVHLSPFSDVAVIQRRFMPKTDRVSASLLSTFTLSSEFFLNPGVAGNLSYHFLEKHGVELSGYYVLTFDRGVTVDLAKIGADVSEEFPIARGFVGLNYIWVPVYGKIALYNKRILAFDTFFNLGAGMSGVKRKGSSQVIWEPAFVLGMGQIFAITRDVGLRWDLRWHSTWETQSLAMSFLNDILFSVGLSYYYPSAGSR